MSENCDVPRVDSSADEDHQVHVVEATNTKAERAEHALISAHIEELRCNRQQVLTFAHHPPQSG